MDRWHPLVVCIFVSGLLVAVTLARRVAAEESTAPSPASKAEAETPAPPAEGTSATDGRDDTAPSAAEQKPCKKRDAVVSVWNELVARGCTVQATKGVPPTALRLLRNVPFAMRGHLFSSPELRKFFQKQRDACGHHWYRPGSKKVELPPGPERRCARRIAKIERSLRKRYPLPAKMETFLIEELGSDLLSLVPVLEGKKGRYGVTSSIEHSDGEWRVTLYDVSPGDEETGDVEFSLTVVCKSDGTECEVYPAG